MIERNQLAKSARNFRSSRVPGFQQWVLLAACAGGSLVGMQACGSDVTATSGGAGASSSGAGAPTGAGAPSGAGAGGAATGAGASNAGAAGAVSASGAAGQGTAGAAGGSAAGAGGAPVAENDDVLERNHHSSRDGQFTQPKLTKAAVPMLTADTTFAATFKGNMWASPLYIANGPGGKGAFIAVTTGNDVFAIDEATGATLWTKNLGSSPTKSGAGCGSISPIGILSTPVIDPVKRVIYVAGAIGTDSIARHEIHAINIENGMEVSGWPVDLTGTKSGSVTFDTMPQNQRSALSLVNGTLYVAYGGHVGDCGNYKGWVIGVNTANPTQRGGWVTLDETGAGIWAAGGMASDGTSVFAVTGNHTPTAANPARHAPDRSTTDSEQVVRITGLGVLDRKDENLFFPTTWKPMDDADADFGASSPVYFSIPGATPPNYVGAVAKDGKLYLLNASNLGGMGGSAAMITVASGSNMAVKTAPTVYRTAEGTHFTFSTDSNAACTGTGPRIVSVLLKAGSPPTGTVDWCAPQTGEVTAPIATTTDGSSDAVVWYMSGNKLNAVDGDSGMPLYTSADSCNGVHRWSSPIAVKGRIVVGGDNHLCSWSAK